MKYLHPLIVFAFIALPFGGAEAYFTTDQSAFRMVDGAALYLIEFKFGHGNYEIRIPVKANGTTEHSREFLSYGLYNRHNGLTENAVSAGIVLGDAQIENGEYVIPKGSRKTLTLLVVASSLERDTRLQVEYLPFTFDGKQELQLNPSELEYYTTELVALP